MPRWKLLAAKLLPYIALGLIQVGTLFVLGAVAFGMKIEGSVAALAVLTLPLRHLTARRGHRRPVNPIRES